MINQKKENNPGKDIIQDPARAACLKLMHQLETYRRIDLFGSGRSGWIDPRCSTVPLFGEARGQMFGVLVCRNRKDEEVILRAFSGQYNGLWEVEGWVPPIIDPGKFDGLVEEQDRRIKALTEKINLLRNGAGPSDAESRKDSVRKLVMDRRALSRELMENIHGLYILTNFEGESMPMAEVFKGGGGIPAGTGDCCLPKLLNTAALAGLQPVEGAEFFWGKGNASGTKRHRNFYPPCEEKCLPVLDFMTRGLNEDLITLLLRGGGAKGCPAPCRLLRPELDIIFADSHLAVVNKPSGVLAVPGRGPGKQDSISARIRTAFPGCPGQPSVHRLDMDTSGLMVFALNPRAHRNLSIQFQRRRVEKEYIALLDGPVRGQEGKIRLSFRLDPDNRPRQVLDPERGKEGVTVWKLLGKSPDGGSMVLFRPLTGRTHQLRLHAAHPFGLGIPICGDRLYGRGVPGEFLRLHASALGFFHPVSGKWMEFRSLPPFARVFGYYSL